MSTYKINLTSAMKAEVTVTASGDLVTATVGRKNALTVLATISPEKLIARRDRARADQSGIAVDACDGYRSAVRSQASLIEEAQMVALLRHLGVTADAVDGYTMRCAIDLGKRVDAPHALTASRAEAQAILAALATASRDEVFLLSVRAERLYQSDWVCPVFQAKQKKLVALSADARESALANAPDDTSWGYAHGGTD